MNILQISFHTSPFGSLGEFDSGGLNVYVQQISKHLSNDNNITVVTAEKAENFKSENLIFYSLNLFEPGLSVEDKEIYLQEFKKKLEETFTLEDFDIIHAHCFQVWSPNKYQKNITYLLFLLRIVLECFFKDTTKNVLIVKKW